MMNISIKPIITGCFLLFIGLVLNEKMLTTLFTEDGSIESLTVRLTILAFNLAFIGAGLFVIVKKWTVITPFPHREYWIPLACLLILSFILYLFTLAGTAHEPFPDFWYFAADSYRVTYQYALSFDHPMAQYQISKHPLYPVFTVPLYYFGRGVFSFLQAPYAENFALSLPVALFGSLSVCLAYASFLKIGFTTKTALLPTALYGFAAAVWYFSSFPESYALITLMTNLFILAVLHDPACKRWQLLVLLNALACYAAPQQFLLGVIPAVVYLTNYGTKSVIPILRYGIGLIVVYLIPYMVFLAIIGDTHIVASEFESVGRFQFAPIEWLLVFIDFTVFSQFTSFTVEETGFERIQAIVFGSEFVWLYILFVAFYTVWGYRTGKTGHLTVAPAILLFFLAYIAFFCFFNPDETFLHTMPALLPLWLMLHSGHVMQQDRRPWQLVILAAVIFSIVSNGSIAWETRILEDTMFRVGG